MIMTSTYLPAYLDFLKKMTTLPDYHILSYTVWSLTTNSHEDLFFSPRGSRVAALTMNKTLDKHAVSIYLYYNIQWPHWENMFYILYR